jgi:hypothetical protein
MRRLPHGFYQMEGRRRRCSASMLACAQWSVIVADLCGTSKPGPPNGGARLAGACRYADCLPARPTTRPGADRPAMRSAYERRPGGLRTGSPPSPPPRLIRPIVRLLPRSPRLSGPGPHQRPCRSGVSCPTRVRPQLFPSQRTSGIQSECHGDAGRDNAPPARCLVACRGSHLPAQGRDGRSRRISPRS